MTIAQRHVAWLAIVFFAALIAVVFHQINTDMVEQGIASGTPYDNAAAYPKAVAILIGILIALQAAIQLLARNANGEDTAFGIARLRRPALLLVIFAAYLYALGVLGYHLSTPLMIVAVMLLCGMRKPFELAIGGLGISFALAFFFEVYLKIVLPPGLFGLAISW